MILTDVQIANLRAGRKVVASRKRSHVGAEYPITREKKGRVVLRATVVAVDGDEIVLAPHVNRTQPVRFMRRTGASHEMDPVENPDFDRGYTAIPNRKTTITDAGEFVEDRYLNRFASESSQAQARRLLDAERRIKERPLADRLAELERMHLDRDLDLSRMLAPIRRRIEAAERKAHQKKAA